MAIGGLGLLTSEVEKAAINEQPMATNYLAISAGGSCGSTPRWRPSWGFWPLGELQLLTAANGPLRSSAPSYQFYEARGIG
jgi:hypothetical protein